LSTQLLERIARSMPQLRTLLLCYQAPELLQPLRLAHRLEQLQLLRCIPPEEAGKDTLPCCLALPALPSLTFLCVEDRWADMSPPEFIHEQNQTVLSHMPLLTPARFIHNGVPAARLGEFVEEM